MGLDIVDSFQSDSKSVADFEQRTGVTLPEDIAAMLTESKNQPHKFKSNPNEEHRT